MLVQKVDNGNRSAFARRVDLTPGAISDMLGGRMSKPGFEVLQKIVLALPTINKNWLLLGEEEMFINNSPIGPPWDSRKAPNNWQGVEDPAPEYYGYLGNFPILTTKDNTIVPIVDADKRWHYSKRDKQNPPPPEFVKYYEPYESLSLPPSLLPAGRHMVFTVTEYSMEPTLTLEDYIVCSYVEPTDWKNISESAICTVVSKTHNNIIARVVVGPEENTIRCYFDNQSNQIRYHPVKFRIEDIEEIWSFAWRLTSSTENRLQKLQADLHSVREKVDRIFGTFRERLKEIIIGQMITENSQDFDAKDIANDNQVRAKYISEYGPIKDEAEYFTNMQPIILSLVRDLEPQVRAKMAAQPAMPKPRILGQD